MISTFLDRLPFPITDPVLVFGMVMLIIFTAPLLFRRYKIPGIIGLILFGAIAGPSAIGLLERDATMVLLGTVGLIYLMFMAGLSIDLNQFNKLRTRSLVFGLFSFFLPQLMALVVGLYLLGYSMESTLLLGSIVGSHTLLAYPLARRLGIAKNKAVTMAMGGSIVTDLISLVVLAVVMASIGGELDGIFWFKFVSMLLLFGASVLYVLPRVGRWFFRTVQNDSSTEYAFLLCCLFISAAVAQAIGLAPIIGAFLAGLALNSLVPENSTSMLRIQFVGDALLVPFFLISVGMLVDFSVLLSSFEVWIYAFVFTSLVLVGKVGAAWIIRAIFKYSKTEFGVVAGLTTPQAAATLAVTLVGFEAGLFSQNAVNAVIVMILITCIIGPILVENYGRKLAVEDEDDDLMGPSIGHHRILVPLSNPSTATALIDLAMMIRDPSSLEPLHPLIVARDGDDVQAQVANSEKMLGHAVIHATAANIPVLPVTRVDLNIASGIERAIKELRISAIVIGWNGQVSTQQRIFGSVLDQLMAETNQLLLVSKLEKPINTNTRIFAIIPPLVEREVGFSSALRSMKFLSNQIGAPITIHTVSECVKRILDLNKTVKPDLDVKVQSYSNWNDMMVGIRSRLNSDDLCVLFNVRESAVGWQPGLNKLPRSLAAMRPDMNLIVAYPAENKMDAGLLKPILSGHSLHKILEPANCTLGLDGTSTSQAVHQMMARFWPDNVDMFEELKSLVLQSVRDHDPELTRGILLLHAHSHTIDSTMLLMGIHPDGLSMSELDHRIHVLFILLSPVDRSPQQHLQNLASIARLVRSDDIVDDLIRMKDTSDLSAFLEVETQPR